MPRFAPSPLAAPPDLPPDALPPPLLFIRILLAILDVLSDELKSQKLEVAESNEIDDDSMFELMSKVDDNEEEVLSVIDS